MDAYAQQPKPFLGNNKVNVSMEIQQSPSCFSKKF
jgi:hypothetical protein